jgi:hypothetical protein
MDHLYGYEIQNWKASIKAVTITQSMIVGSGNVNEQDGICWMFMARD